MPESKKRRKVIERQKAQSRAAATRTHVPPAELHSPRWWAITMVALMIVGLIIVVMAYVTSGQLPIPNAGNWNLGLGIGLMIGGFLMTMGWK